MRNLLFFEVPFYGNYIFNNHFYIRLSIFYSFVRRNYEKGLSD